MAVLIFLHNLERILDQNGLSKPDLAKMLDLHPGTVNNWWQRKSLPETKVFNALVEKLEIDAQELFQPINSVNEIIEGASESLSNTLHDVAKIKDKNDELLISLVVEQLIPNPKALTRFKVTNQGESSKLLIQSQKIRLLELAQKVSGVENIPSSEEVPLAAKIKQLSETQLLLIESAIDGLLLADARKNSKKEVS